MREATKLYLKAIFIAPVPVGALGIIFGSNFFTGVIGAFLGLAVGILPQYISFRNMEIRHEKELELIKSNRRIYNP